MSVLVYAIAHAGSGPPPAGPGINGGELRCVSALGLVAVIETAGGPVSCDPEQLLRYEEVVEQIMEGRTMLPVRYGSLMDDDEAVRKFLAEHAAEFDAALRRVDGAVEIGVRAEWTADLEDPDAADGADGAGAAYIRTRLARRRRASELRARLDRALGSIAREGVYRLSSEPGMAMSASYLVDRDAGESFLDRFADFAETVTENDAVLSCSGPWPPYSFVGGSHR